MQLERRKECSKIRHLSILIPYTAGQVYFYQIFLSMADGVLYSWDTVSSQIGVLQNRFSTCLFQVVPNLLSTDGIAFSCGICSNC